jgi:YesN/AraC family two-component response regulator
MKHVLKIIFKDEVQTIFDLFSSIFDVRIIYYSPEGNIIKVGLNRPNSRYCQLIQNELHRKQSCLSTDQQKREEAKSKGKTIQYSCHADLKEVLTPIYNDGYLLGFMGYGQFRQNNSISSRILNAWIQKYEDPSELTQAYQALPYYEREKAQDMLELFSVLVNHIVSKHMITAKGDFLLQKILEYIHSNIEDPVSLYEISSYVGRSSSTISHLFKNKLNLSFKETMINIKLDKAEEYFRTCPHLKISEVAEKIGYSDPLYFSRIYKKYRLKTPSQYKKKHLLSDTRTDLY